MVADWVVSDAALVVVAGVSVVESAADVVASAVVAGSLPVTYPPIAPVKVGEAVTYTIETSSSLTGDALSLLSTPSRSFISDTTFRH